MSFIYLNSECDFWSNASLADDFVFHWAHILNKPYDGHQSTYSTWIIHSSKDLHVPVISFYFTLISSGAWGDFFVLVTKTQYLQWWLCFKVLDVQGCTFLISIINPLLLHFSQTYRTSVHLLEIFCICMYFLDQWVHLFAQIESIHFLIVN